VFLLVRRRATDPYRVFGRRQTRSARPILSSAPRRAVSGGGISGRKAIVEFLTDSNTLERHL